MSGALEILAPVAFVGGCAGAVAAVRLLAARARGGKDPPEPGAGVAIGRAVDSKSRTVSLGHDELHQGVLIGGSPGAGKTTLLVILGRGVDPKVGAVFVDLKGDRSLAGRLGIERSCVFGLGDRAASAWNPLARRGNPASWRDVLMSAEEWSEPHFRRAAARFLGALMAALQQVRGEVVLTEVVALLERSKLATGLARDARDRERAALEAAIDAIENESSLRSGVVGLGNRLALLADSPATMGLFGAAGGIELDSVFQGERVLFSLPAAEFPEEAPAIAAMVVQSLGAAGQRLSSGDEVLRALLVVDEAPRLGGDQLREAVAIGRGAGIGSVVAVQDFADLDYVAAGTREAVETGANTWVVMRQVASAERIAQAFGSQTTTRRTVQHDRRRLVFTPTGVESEREVEEFRVSPNLIRRLATGEAVVWRRLRGGRLERITLEAGERPAADRSLRMSTRGL